MKPRTSKLLHPLGYSIETPLLVSSFSSKGFRFIEKIKSDTKSEVGELISSVSEFITESALVSAFDLKYYLGSGKDLRKKYKLSPSVLFIDSGGYETLEDFDSTEVFKHPIKTRLWNKTFYEEELEKIPKNIPAIIISYDNGQEKRIPLKKQIERATQLFNKNRGQLNDFLIKHINKKYETLNIDEIKDNISLLKKFNIIGVTEKELGSSMLQRMKNIDILRTELDNVGCTSPIHVFGNLDPLTSVLYFLHGAEIFDGLTWLRYAFYEGMSVYKSNADIMENRITQKDILNSKTAMTQNLIYLQRLKEEMRASVEHIRKGEYQNASNCYSFINNDLQKIISSYKI